MQIQLQAFGKQTDSLRKVITDDLLTTEHAILVVKEVLNKERKPGWSTITGNQMPGALKLEWDNSARMLLVRVVTRAGNSPHRLLGTFLEYLMERHGKKIASINIQLR